MTTADRTTDGQSDRFDSPARLGTAACLVVGLAVAVAVCLIFGIASVWCRESGTRHLANSLREWTWWTRHAFPCGTEAIIAFWFFVLGGCLGSFLNVVVYRLPRGQTLLGHSRCPVCQTPIRARDNIPVWGWIRRRGRCHQCREPISVRYPLLELTVAYLLLILAILEMPLQGIHLLGTLQPMRIGFTTTLFEWQPEGIGRFVMHATLLAILIASAWIRFDRQRIPWGLACCGLAVTIGLSFLLPETRDWQLNSLHWGSRGTIQFPTWLQLLGGGLLGIAWWAVWQRDGIGSMAILAYVGATLGLAAGLYALLATRVLCPRPGMERAATPPGPLFVATSLVLSTWWLLFLWGVR